MRLEQWSVAVVTVFVFSNCSSMNKLEHTGKKFGLTPDESRETILKHVVQADEDGGAIRPSVGLVSGGHGAGGGAAEEFNFEDCFEDYVDDILEEADRWADGQEQPGATRILIHVHGGLTFRGIAYDRALETSQRMMADEHDPHYPIYLVWPSDCVSTYTEHLLSVRQGVKSNRVWWMTPAILGADILRTVAKSPVSLYGGIVRYKDARFAADESLGIVGPTADEIFSAYGGAKSMFIEDRDGGDSTFPERLLDEGTERIKNRILSRDWRNYERIVSDDTMLDKYNIRPSKYKYGWKDRGTYKPYETLTLGARICTNPVVLGQIATAAWDIMLRRTNNMYRTAEEYDVADEEERRAVVPRDIHGVKAWEHKPTGAFARFFRMLVDHCEDNKNNRNYEITLVGHSMGAHVLNRLLQDDRVVSGLLEGGRLKNIVYMGAACTIEDLAQTMVPLLKRAHEIEDPESERIASMLKSLLEERPSTSEKDAQILNESIKTLKNMSEQDGKAPRDHYPRFYNLMLNRVAEVKELNFGNLAPQGSLLEWIDNHYTQPESLVHRTAGKERNIIPAVHLFHEVQDHVVFKSFDREHGRIPQKHGEFNDIPFWRESCWQVEESEVGKEVIASYSETWWKPENDPASQSASESE